MSFLNVEIVQLLCVKSFEPFKNDLSYSTSCVVVGGERPSCALPCEGEEGPWCVAGDSWPKLHCVHNNQEVIVNAIVDKDRKSVV